jgi:UDP-N-acetylmuramoyl-tripeptide--D-alanyl-D-alanine ligase
MAELGLESLQEHAAIIELLKQHPWKAVVLVGGDFMKLDHPFVKMANAADAAKWFADQQFNDTYFLIKGSRSMQMEKVLG